MRGRKGGREGEMQGRGREKGGGSESERERQRKQTWRGEERRVRR